MTRLGQLTTGLTGGSLLLVVFLDDGAADLLYMDEWIELGMRDPGGPAGRAAGGRKFGRETARAWVEGRRDTGVRNDNGATSLAASFMTLARTP